MFMLADFNIRDYSLCASATLMLIIQLTTDIHIVRDYSLCASATLMLIIQLTTDIHIVLSHVDNPADY